MLFVAQKNVIYIYVYPEYITPLGPVYQPWSLFTKKKKKHEPSKMKKQKSASFVTLPVGQWFLGETATVRGDNPYAIRVVTANVPRGYAAAPKSLRLIRQQKKKIPY